MFHLNFTPHPQLKLLYRVDLVANIYQEHQHRIANVEQIRKRSRRYGEHPDAAELNPAMGPLRDDHAGGPHLDVLRVVIC